MLDDFDPFADDGLDGDLFADIDPFAELTIETDKQLPQPLTHRREARRQMVMNLKKQALSDLIPQLPPPGVDLHIVGNGEGREAAMGAALAATGFDFGSFALHLCELLGAGCHCYVSTWVMNSEHVRMFLEMLDDGRIEQLTILTDPFFKKRHTSAIANSLILGIARHPGRARYLAFKNHCKILCIASADESRTVTVTGSANFTQVSRAENYVLSTAPELYFFYVNEFFGAILK